MQSTLDVFVVGKATNLPPEPTGLNPSLSCYLIPTGALTLREFAGTAFAKQMAEGDGDLVALISGCIAESLSEIKMMMTLIGSGSDVAAMVAVDQVDGANLSTVQDPTCGIATGHGVRVLLAPRAGHGPIVFRRSRLKAVGPLRPVAEPVWDWLIRAVRTGEKIDSLPIGAGLRSTECRLPLLAPPRPGKDCDWLREHLTAFEPKEFGLNPSSKTSETALRAGLFQWHDFLDESHQLSQRIEGEGEDRLGDYWHAIMHRREPDYSNAKYWFRQIGRQQTYRPLQKEAGATLATLGDPAAGLWRDRLQPGAKWDPFAFVDLCEECAADETTDLAYAARRIQYVEMSLLMGMTCRQCGGGDESVNIALAAQRA
jgi:hypothetical protein